MSTAKKSKKSLSSSAKSSRKKKTAPVDSEHNESGEEDLEEEEEEVVVPKAKTASKKAGASDGDPPVVVPARRLTPEARAAVNAMVAKGISLQEALRATAKWETFVAPVREATPPTMERGSRPDGAPGPGRFNRRPVEDDHSEDEAGAAALLDEDAVDISSDD